MNERINPDSLPATADTVAGGRLRNFVERVERLNEELKSINEDKKEVFAEARGEGFDVKALKEIVRLRGLDRDAQSEFEAIVEMYKTAMGME